MTSTFQKYFKLGMERLQSKVLTGLSIMSGTTLVKPIQVFYNISNKCNARCLMCPQWVVGKTEKEDSYLKLNEVKSILDQMAQWGVTKFGISGGEPLIYRDKTLSLLKYANSKGLYSHVVTNGLLLDKEFIIEYDRHGGGHITISLDGLEKTQDYLRQTKGTFRRCIEALTLFNDINPSNIMLKINTVINNLNIGELVEVVKIAEKHNAKIFFQPYDSYDYRYYLKHTQQEVHEKYDLWVEEKNNRELYHTIQQIKELKRKDPVLILNSQRHLDNIPRYFANNLPRDKNFKCLAAYDSIFINPQGNVNMCWIGKIGNVKDLPLKELWKSPEFEKVRKKSLACRYPCMLGCLIPHNLSQLAITGIKLLIKKKRK